MTDLAQLPSPPQLPAAAPPRPLRAIYEELGRALAARERIDEAIAAFEQALREESGPDDWDIRVLLIMLRGRRGQTATALRECLEVALGAPERAVPLLPYMHGLLSRAAVLRDREWLQAQPWRQVVESADLAAHDRVEFALLFGRIWLLLGQAAEAQYFYERGVALAPEHTQLREGLGEVLWQLGMPGRAADEFRRAAALAAAQAHDAAPAIQARLVQALAEDGQFAAALDAIPQTIAPDQPFAAELLLTRGRSSLALGQPARALADGEQADAAQPGMAAALLRAQALIALHRSREALELLAGAQKLNPANAVIPLYEVQARIEGDIDLPAALDTLQGYCTSDPGDLLDFLAQPAQRARQQDPLWHYFHAHVQLALGRLQEALAAAERAESLDAKTWAGQSVALAALTAEALERSGRKEEAAPAYRAAFERYRELASYERSVAMGRRAWALDPTDRDLAWNLAHLLRYLSYRDRAPYVVRELLDEALTTWDAATRLRPISSQEAWALLVRSWMSEQQARDPAESRWRRLAEAIGYSELQALLTPTDSYGLTRLAETYQAVSLNACAYVTAQTARTQTWEGSSSWKDALKAQIYVLTNWGSFAPALQLIEKLEAPEDPDLNGVRAYIALREGKLEEATRLSKQVLRTAPEPISLWIYETDAGCSILSDRLDDARSDLRPVWERRDLDDRSNLSNYGWAGFVLGQFDEATRYYEQLLREPLNQIGSRQMIGECRLASGDPGGEREVARWISVTTERRELGDFLLFELRLLRQYAQGDSTVRAALDRLEAQARQRREELGPPLAFEIDDDSDALRQLQQMARAELEELLADPQRAPLGEWPWLAAQLGAARLALAAQDWDAAGERYLALWHYSERFPPIDWSLEQIVAAIQRTGGERVSDDPGSAAAAFEAALRLAERALPASHPRRLDLHDSAGQAYLRLGQPADARRHFALALGSAADAGAPQRAEELHVAIALAALDERDAPEARAHFAAAISEAREQTGADASSSLGMRLARIAHKLIRDVDHLWAVFDALREAETGADAPRADLHDFRVSLLSYFDSFSEPGPAGLTIPITTPLVFEVSDALVPFVDSRQDGGRFLYELIPAMRDRIKAETGVRVTGVRARGNPALPPGGYEIQLDEVPASRGQAVLGHRYFDGAPALVKERVPDAAGFEAAHPVTGAPGYWLPESASDRLAAAGITTWSTPEYLIAQIEAVLRRNLALFLGVQEVDALLAEWGKAEGGGERVASALPGASERLRFTWLLKRLVAERVPITNSEALLAAAGDLGPAPVSLAGMVRAARQRLRAELPGNAPDTTRITLTPEQERALLGYEDGQPFLAATPAEKLEFLSWLRATMQPLGQNAALVTESADLRPLLRRLIEPEFPEVPVLDAQELLAAPSLSAEERDHDERDTP